MKKSTFQKMIVYILLPILVVSMPFVFSVFAQRAPSYDWYFRPNETHARPELMPEAAFLSSYDSVITIGPDEKVIFLTFDAGFDNGNMAKILDTLQEKKVPAAFFVDGNFVKTQESLVKRICSEGHILGNHTLSHADMSTLTDFQKYKEQIEGWNKLVTAAGGKQSDFFRFPCGRFSETALKFNERLGLKSVFWSFAYFDWDTENQPDRKAALNKILSRTHNGCIMLLHSVSSTNAELLPDLIDKLRSEGYQFKSLNDIK